ncbi:alpha/beta hydrolase [Mariniflexile soesokkakense]|uniref:Alpha/beta hydrolase n=1 Tax=Mariniflexile soesokkakense TaxID=1343160 RepID=A0ABV0AD22_9FLAO
MKNSIIVIVLIFAFKLSAQSKTTYTYAIKVNDTLKLDVYTPQNLKPSDSLPVLLWMHGGGFAIGSRDYIDDMRLVEYVAKNQNYIGISISYRLLRKETETGFGCNCPKEEKLETFQQAAIDYLDAAKYVVEHSKELNIDRTKIIAGGSSAGAEGILNAVFMREYFSDDLQQYKNVKFAGAMAFAGAVVNANYITKNNAVPTVLFHGTDDQLVPYGSASHHYCEISKPGYLILDGASIIAEKLMQFETSYYFNVVKGGRHEISAIPFSQLDKIFAFFDKTVLHDEVIQTKIIQTKTL